MARRASTIFAPKASYNPPDSVNTGGYPAWTRDLEERVLQVLLTNTLGNTFYAVSMNFSRKHEKCMLKL